MAAPPGVGERDFTEAIRLWGEAVGPEWVFTSDEDVALYRDAFSPFYGEPEEKVASAAVAPDTVEQVQAVVRIANEKRIPLYPISTGRNLAYGGPAPVYSGSVVLDLKRMNRVLEVNERNASALVEPGVSYFELYRHIQEQGLKLWIDCPDPGWGSLIGNALDRGAGYTPYRDHFDSHCGMEVVLADGTLLRTGMGALPGAQTWQQFKYGYGPLVDGLFSQSNFGVVTKMGFWLLPEPEAYRSLRVIAPRRDDIVPLIDVMSHLIYAGVITTTAQVSSPVFNGARDPELAELLLKPGGASAAELDAYAQGRDISFWEGRFTFMGLEKVVDAQVEHARERFGTVAGVRFEESETLRFPMSAEAIAALPDKNRIGVPSLTVFTGLAVSRPGGQGHSDFSVIIPMTGEAVLEACTELYRGFAELGVEMNVGTPASFHPRSLVMISAFPVTRDREHNAKIRAAFKSMVQFAAARGWGQYRTAAAFMDDIAEAYSFNDHALRRFHERLKDAVDPNGILSAGRYGIWPKHIREA